MNLVLALILFNILILLYQIIIEVFTILFRITGINLEKSRFQVISILTCTGFTTSESETMLLTKRRRKLTTAMMMFSYIFNVTIVSIIVNLLMSTSTTNIHEIKLGILLTVINIILIFFVRRSKLFKSTLDKFIIKITNSKIMRKGNSLFVYDTYGTKSIVEVEINNLRESFKNKTIEEIGLKEKYDIQLLVLKRGEDIIDLVYGDVKLENNDVIVVFGKMKNIKAAFLKSEEKVKTSVNK